MLSDRLGIRVTGHEDISPHPEPLYEVFAHSLSFEVAEINPPVDTRELGLKFQRRFLLHSYVHVHEKAYSRFKSYRASTHRVSDTQPMNLTHTFL